MNYSGYQAIVAGRRTPIETGKRTLIMGILNITPDSFSDGGRYLAVEQAVEHAQQMVIAGADIIDIGAESTRPHAEQLSLAEEWQRLEPVLALLRAAVSIPLSIDTYKAEVARRALASGVDIVNDVWGGVRDPLMNRVVAESAAHYVIMHNDFGQPEVTSDIVQHVQNGLQRLVDAAITAGVGPERIWLDPGIGFGKTVKQNLDLINRLDELSVLGFPLLIGTSRKSVIGHVLDLPIFERVEGTAAMVSIAIARGADVVRVHDVTEMTRVARMTDALVRTNE